MAWYAMASLESSYSNPRAVTEYLEGGTLQALLDAGLMAKTGHPLSLYVRMKIARDIVKGCVPRADCILSLLIGPRMIFVHKHCLCHHGAPALALHLAPLIFL